MVDIMRLSHHETIPACSLEKLPSTKPVPGANKVGDCYSKKTFPRLWLSRVRHTSLLPLGLEASRFSEALLTLLLPAL